MKKMKIILIKLKRKVFPIFSLKNIYIILLVGIWPALFFYFDIFSLENQNLTFLILGIVALVSTLVVLFLFKNREAKIVDLIIFLLFGFLGLRLIEFFLIGEEADQLLEETVYFYTMAAFVTLFVYLSLKIYKNSYTGRIVVLAAVIFSLMGSFLFSYISELDYERRNFQEQATRLFDALMLYESSFPPRTWETYLDPDYDFFFSYPPNFSYNSIKKNVSVETKEMGSHNNKNSLDEFWTPECIKKLNKQGRKILLCENDFNCGREKIYFIQGANLIKVVIEQCPLSQAEFDALVNSFDIY